MGASTVFEVMRAVGPLAAAASLMGASLVVEVLMTLVGSLAVSASTAVVLKAASLAASVPRKTVGG